MKYEYIKSAFFKTITSKFIKGALDIYLLYIPENDNKLLDKSVNLEGLSE